MSDGVVTEPPSMRDAERHSQVFIGWDVGGWNCDRNRASRDALVILAILDGDLVVLGNAWRGNLRKYINDSVTTRDWLETIFQRCQAPWPNGVFNAVVAIDTPLGFSEAFVRLVTRLDSAPQIGNSATNPYLFRETERMLIKRAKNKRRPLSAVKDMIGSQATKGMHVLAKFAPEKSAIGAWSDNNMLTVIEAYPSACRHSETINELRSRDAVRGFVDGLAKKQGTADKCDALDCALIAYLYAEKREALEAPPNTMRFPNEGWIWVPRDALDSIT